MRFLLVAAAAAAMFATPAMAEPTVVTVELTGEGGGAMAAKLDASSVPAGEVTLRVANHALTAEHELILVRLTEETDPIPMLKKKQKVDEDKLWTLGEVEELKPSESGELTAKLKPGVYLVFCNLQGHFQAGMWAHFKVTKG
jgi:uncharacterized cupredoxin-like copper-binding protein